MVRITIRLILCAALVLSAGAGFAADWPQFRGPERNGLSSETGLLKQWPAAGPKVLWEAPLGPGYSSMAVAGGKVFTQYQDAQNAYLVAFDEQTGKPLWKIVTGTPYVCATKHNGPRATPTVEGDVVYAHDGAGNLICAKVADGSIVWQKNTLALAGARNVDWGMAGSPAIAGDLLLVNPGGPGASMMALNKKSGEIVWKSGSDKAGYSTAVRFKGADGEQFLFFTEFGLEGVSATDGKVLWSYPWKTDWGVNAADPVVSGGEVLICSGYNHGAALLKPAAGKVEKIWEEKHFRNNFGSTPLLIDGYLYGTDDPKNLECVELKTGQLKWKLPLAAKGQLTCADGLAYIFSEDGTLTLAKITPEKGEIVSSVKILPGQQRWALPVVANGRLYLRNDKKLLCLDVKGQ